MHSQNIALAAKTDGTLWSWGYNGPSGVLGKAFALPGHRSSPVQIPGTSWKQLACTENISAATRTDGTLWAWGNNAYGNLAQNDRTNRSSPIQIPGTGWSKLSGGKSSVSAGFAALREV